MGVTKNRSGIAHNFMQTVTVHRTHGRQLIGGIARTVERIQQERENSHQERANRLELISRAQNTAPNARDFARLTEEEDNNMMFLGDDESSSVGDDISMQSVSDSDGDSCVQVGKFVPHIGKQFEGYMRNAQEHALSFTKKQRRAVRLLIRLRKTKASLATHEDLMQWYFVETGQLREGQKVAKCSEYITREKVFKMLKIRYNVCPESHGNLKEITLPHAKAKVNIVWNDAQAAIVSLLTDPRIVDNDYLFFNNDPLASPPKDQKFVKDLNTGSSYTETYAKLIKTPGKQVLLPVIFYIDGANTGQFSDLPITAVKISLGIFTRKARDKEHLWRTIGYIPTVSQTESRGKRTVIDSNHQDGVMAHPDALEEEGIEVDNTVAKAQDLHSMLAEILASYVKLQESGFLWDLRYRGVLYPNVEFVLYTPFFKVDGDEAEKLCGKYTSRGANVAQLCRYCECPTDQSDVPLAQFEYKTKAKILAMTRANDVAGLQLLSQQLIENATYALRFGTQTRRGIHGACPMEMLHATLLGIFKYIRDCLFNQMGPTSKLAADFNALAQKYGELLSRQSDRDLPKTRFQKGIVRGKLMAKEFPGILLCMAAGLRSSKGQAINSEPNLTAFG